MCRFLLPAFALLALCAALSASRTAYAYELHTPYAFMADDCDSDGLSDEIEEGLGLEPCVADTDGDSLSDLQEVREFFTNARSQDSDSDGVGDAAEALRYHTNPNSPDSDTDGLADGAEINTTHTSPMAADTDGDGLSDGEEMGRFGCSPTTADTDGDGLADGVEVLTLHTDPKSPDTDADGLSDRDETQHFGTDPANADIDNDGLLDGVEALKLRTDPRRADTDGDSIPDGRDRCPLLRGIADRAGCPVAPRVGGSAAFPDIRFTDAAAAIDTADALTLAALERMRAFMEQCPGLSVIVEGYASGATEKRNLEVSELCAGRAAAWLLAHGIGADQIELAVGYGSRKGEAAAPVRPARGVAAPPSGGRTIVLRVARTCE